MADKNKRVLLTGGAGYIGSRVSELLLGSGYNLVIADSLMYGDEGLSNLSGFDNFKFLKGDITSNTFLKRVFDSNHFDAVIHLAAIVGDPACAKEPELARAVNWEASLKILDYAVRGGTERFLFASTCSNYGKMDDPEGYVDEESPLAPVSLYAELKVRFENIILKELGRKDNFYPTSLRFATAYGVSPRMRFDLTVNEFIKELTLGRELEVFGEKFWRPYCHVYDLARAVLIILESDAGKVAYRTFNVGDTAENYQKRMIVEEIKKLISDAKTKYVKKDEDPRDYRVSFEKIKNELGFTVSKRLTDGISEIKRAIEDKLFQDPDHKRYKNN